MTVLDVEVETNVSSFYKLQRRRGDGLADVECDYRHVFPTPESFIKVWQLAESLDDVVETLEGAYCTADRATICSRAARYRESHDIPLQYFPQAVDKQSTDWEAMRELVFVSCENND